jgi:aspartate kinase
MLVLKFGGTSVESAERIRQVVDLCAQAKSPQKVVVLSAMSGVTNALIDGAEKALARDLGGALSQIEAIRKRHLDAITALLGTSQAGLALKDELASRLDELSILYKGVSYLGELTRRSLDAVSGLGELLSSRLVAEFAIQSGHKAVWLDAREFLITDEVYGKANPRWDVLTPKAQTHILPHTQAGTIVFTQGFIGRTESGASTTLGRGGSDYSASIVGVALNSNEIQIWTDVDGMMTADPRVVPEARVLPEVSFQEASELAYFGAKVLHPLTIKPAIEKNIPVRILNTMRPDQPGTLIKSAAQATETIRAVAAKKGITAIFLSSPRMLMSHGFLSQIFALFDRYKTPIDLIATSEISVSLTIDQTDYLSELKEALLEHGEVRTSSDVAIVSVVGRQFREQSGIAGRVFSALKDINIVMISGGASDINLSFVVSRDDADKAMKQLHAEFFP